MSKPIKNEKLNARVDTPFKQKVGEYLAAANMNEGDIVRDGVAEYMVNHPIKVPPMNILEGVKPGGKDHGRSPGFNQEG